MNIREAYFSWLYPIYRNISTSTEDGVILIVAAEKVIFSFI